MKVCFCLSLGIPTSTEAQEASLGTRLLACRQLGERHVGGRGVGHGHQPKQGVGQGDQLHHVGIHSPPDGLPTEGGPKQLEHTPGTTRDPFCQLGGMPC